MVQNVVRLYLFAPKVLRLPLDTSFFCFSFLCWHRSFYIRTGKRRIRIFRISYTRRGGNFDRWCMHLRLRECSLAAVLLLAVPALLERLLLLRADAGFLSILNIVLSFLYSSDVFVVMPSSIRACCSRASFLPNSETVFGALLHLFVSRVYFRQHLRNGGCSSAAGRSI